MQRITIGRYGTIPADVPRSKDVVPAQDMYAGWIEGVRDDGTEWILFMDHAGSPSLFWPVRDSESGAVDGNPVVLQSS